MSHCTLMTWTLHRSESAGVLILGYACLKACGILRAYLAEKEVIITQQATSRLVHCKPSTSALRAPFSMLTHVMGLTRLQSPNLHRGPLLAHCRAGKG